MKKRENEWKKNFIVALQQRHKNYVVKFSIFSPPPVFVQSKTAWTAAALKLHWRKKYFVCHIKRDFEELLIFFFWMALWAASKKRNNRKKVLQQWRHKIMNLISFMATTIVAKCSRTLVHWQTIRFHFFFFVLLLLMLMLM